MTFLTYLLQSSVCVALLWLAYHLLLRKEPYFMLSRLYLLAVVPFAFVVPLLRLPLLPAVVVETAAGSGGGGALEPASIVPSEAAATVATFAPERLWLLIYLAGTGYFLYRFVKRMYRVRKTIAQSRFSDSTRYTAFTFFRKIYINRKALSAADYEKVWLHEQAHARQLHSLDLLLAEGLIVLQWFNPFAWKLRQSLAEVHEYLADAQVLAHGVEREAYKQLLYHQATGIHPEYASGFSYSLTKKRLIMIKKHKPSRRPALRWAGLLLVASVPVVLFGLAPASAERPVIPSETVMDEEQHVLIASGTGEAAAVLPVDGAATQTVANSSKSKKKLSFYVMTPDDATTGAAKNGQSKDEPPQKQDATTDVQMMQHLVVSEHASVDSSRIFLTVKDSVYGDAERTVQKNDDKTSSEKAMRLNEVDVPPEYPGGVQALYQFLSRELKYPPETKEKGIEGRVVVQFVIQSDGTIGNVEVLRGVDPALDAEAVRIVALFPKWTPGQSKGTAVAVRYILPILFQADRQITVD